MLGKLFKHEFKATGRLFLPLYGMVVILTPLLALLSKLFFTDIRSSIIDSPLVLITILSIVGYVLLMVGVGVASFVLIVIRFYQSMTKESAYLTFMLPVKTSRLILSKLTVALIWQIISVIIIFLSIGAFTYTCGVWSFEQLHTVWNSFLQLMEIPSSAERAQIITLFILYLLTMLVGAIGGILQIYASISLGQLAKKHRVAASFGFYIAFYVGTQIISSLLLLPIQYLITTSNSLNSVLDVQITIILIGLTITLIYSIVYYIVSTIMFKRHLNLE
ncbi:MAG: hypothetical protein J6I65_00510 [Lachnospiraceae bacterium]|nr:hypothetical protein [Lachnospiraceae bacterium]